jgi:hypothetical protein
MQSIPAPDFYDVPMHINQKNPTKTNTGKSILKRNL